MPAHDLFNHLRAAYADGAAGADFSPPMHTPFANKRDAEEDAYGAYMEGRDERQAALDNAIAKQPHAFEISGRAHPRSAGVGAERSTPPAASAPEPLDIRALVGGFGLGMVFVLLGLSALVIL